MPPFIVFIRATPETEAVSPDKTRKAVVAAMTQFEGDMKAAGILKRTYGLHPTSDSCRIQFHKDRTDVVRGPFPEMGSLVSAFYKIDVSSKQEAIDWASRVPFAEAGVQEVEVRPVHVWQDFDDALTPELREQEKKQFAAAAALAAGSSGKQRFIVLLKGNADTEAGKLPDKDLLEAMGKFNQELVDAEMMLDGEGLHASSQGVRVRFEAGKVQVSEGPLPLSKQIICGYWALQADSMDEAVSWLKRIPKPSEQEESEYGEVEIRPVCGSGSCDRV